jgi:hypothetical protein
VTKIRFRALAAAYVSVIAVLSGCSGSHSVTPAAVKTAATAAPQAKTGNAKFSLTIPARPATQSARRAQYISASTQSGKVVVGASTTIVDLTAGGPNCTPVTNGRSCTISVVAPIGVNDAFALTLYDLPNASGNSLSASVGFTATVSEGAANVTTLLVLDGIPATYKLVVMQQPAAYATSGTAGSGAAVLDVYDADANLIVGPGNYTDGSNAVTGFTVGLSSANYKLALNGGAALSSVHVNAPSDQLTLTQTAAALGANLTVTPDITTIANTGQAAFIRPTGLSSTSIESSQVSSGATGTQLAPISGQTYGVGGWANYGGIGEFYTGAAATTAASCGTGFVRVPDMAVANGVVWYQNAGDLNVDFGTCTTNPQFIGTIVGVTDVGVGNGVVLVDIFTPHTCFLHNLVPGVFDDPGSGTPTGCTFPHDIISNGAGYYAVINTNFFDGFDHLATYHGITFASDVAISHSGINAAGNSLESVAPRADDLFIEDIAGARLWSVSEPTSTTPAAVMGFISLPAGYTYADNRHFTTFAWSNRTLAIGADGLAYVAVTSPYNGVLAFDPVSGAVVMQLPNDAASSGLAPLNVVSDGRGTIYWSAGADLMHYPSNVSQT